MSRPQRAAAMEYGCRSRLAEAGASVCRKENSERCRRCHVVLRGSRPRFSPWVQRFSDMVAGDLHPARVAPDQCPESAPPICDSSAVGDRFQAPCTAVGVQRGRFRRLTRQPS
ncbi:hypothetical protein NDU88_002655 [Pleurodeles waltl]|uniref:Uncharacterized protein n=1 Tax=Pleurodeles waltl TaxID=8319 RepID=A0AAV7RAM0_PLEWA|nr:hypothetical protein NDU88_002655 [Pleurodeles waltl]